MTVCLKGARASTRAVAESVVPGQVWYIGGHHRRVESVPSRFYRRGHNGDRYLIAGWVWLSGGNSHPYSLIRLAKYGERIDEPI